MEQLIRLCDLPLERRAEVAEIHCREGLIDRIGAMGIVEGSEIVPVFRSPFGDPSAYAVKHALIALRRQDSEAIWVRCENVL